MRSPLPDRHAVSISCRRVGTSSAGASANLKDQTCGAPTSSRTSRCPRLAHGAQTWKQLGDVLNWKPGVLQKLADAEQEVLLNLDSVDARQGVTRAASGRGGATDWELLAIRDGGFPNLEFWLSGERVSDPFL